LQKKALELFLKKTFDLVPVFLLSNNLNFPPCNCTEICVYQTMTYLHPKSYHRTENGLGKKWLEAD
jgi:hypothetical protein